MGGGAWPFLVGGVICLVNSDNERDLNLLNSFITSALIWLILELDGGTLVYFLEGLFTVSNRWKFEAITGL
jgi:hypothetical protein